MIKFTTRLDKAIKRASWAHEQAGQHRKGTDIPYIIHPFGTMLIASGATDDENTLIACLMHDILEDVEPNIYNETKMKEEFGDKVVEIVKDVTKNLKMTDWHQQSQAYLNHLENKASDQAVIVSASDKIHNINSLIQDYKVKGEEIWQIFTTKSSDDQIWWYRSILQVLKNRRAPEKLINILSSSVEELETMIQI